MSTYRGRAILIAGTNGTGKTTLTVDKFIKPHKRKVLILIGDDMEELFWDIPEITLEQIPFYSGVAKMVVTDPEETMLFLHKENPKGRIVNPRSGTRETMFYDGIIVIDDARTVATNRDEPIRTLYQKRRQMKTDYIFICHSLFEYPISCWTWTTDCILFQTIENFARVRSRVPYSHIVEKIFNHVNKQAEKDPHYFYSWNLKQPPNI